MPHSKKMPHLAEGSPMVAFNLIEDVTNRTDPNSILTSAIKLGPDIEKIPLNKILTLNPYEKLVPFNLWFEHDMYKVANLKQNDQNIRIRYFNSIMLTPLVTIDNKSLEPIRHLMPNLSLYQPFYPENFYQGWEFLQLGHISSHHKKFLHIGAEDRLGLMEALVLYRELQWQTNCCPKFYHLWVTEPNCKIDYLGQGYKVNLVGNDDLLSYDFISIDCLKKLSSILGWKNQETDLHAVFYYLLTALKHLERDGCMLLRLNMLGCQSWTYIFGIVIKCFKEYEFIRPSVIHAFNSEIYLFLNKFAPSKFKDNIAYGILKNLHRQKISLAFKIGLPKVQNQISRRYDLMVEKWALKVAALVPPKGSGLINWQKEHGMVNWHREHGLKYIGQLENKFDPEPINLELVLPTIRLKIKPYPSFDLYSNLSYQKLEDGESNLNYYKRVMDTKPSLVFVNRSMAQKKGHLLTWETLSWKIDLYQNLKYIVRKMLSMDREKLNPKVVTNAWTKMYEMLNTWDLLPKKLVVKTFHVCEAPGAFVSAVGHFLSRRNQELNFYAQTIRPTKDGGMADHALEDHFGLIRANPQRWLFGDESADFSGDITHSAVIKSYASNNLLADIDFMTADAGLHCHPTDLNEQEGFMAKINMGQIVCILACLAVGKSAIIKTFLPMAKPLTISLIYLLSQLFNKVTICKPSTSHSANSEVYVILQNYKGIDPKELQILYLLLDDPKVTCRTLLFSKIEKRFIQSYEEIVSKLVQRQIQALARHYYYYYHMEEVPSLRNDMERYTKRWLEKNPV